MKNSILKNVDILYLMWKKGLLGGEKMPEDENPHLEKSSADNYLYFTLPMALNYQRNSYTLWEAANKTFQDQTTRFVFNPQEVIKRPFAEIQFALVKYRLALQKVKQTQIWIKLCQTFVEMFDGDIRKFFDELDNDIVKIKDFIQCQEKSKFPYLSGNKICNYWLFVILQYTDRKFKNIERLTVAPDTHVIKSTHRLKLISDQELSSPNVQHIVIDRWNVLLEGTKFKPIDIHTALWLWSRNGFMDLDESLLDEKIYKKKIKSAYENNKYLENFRSRELLPFEKEVFDYVIKLIPKDSKILDLGCGNGYPYDHYFCAKGFDLTGIDFCEKFINQAKTINPTAQYQCADIEKYAIDKKYDLVMMLFSLLHIPRENHKSLLQKIYDSLNEGSIFLLTLRDEDAGILKYKDDFCGQAMFWSYFDFDTYKVMLEKIGFTFLYAENQNKHGISESNNWVILKK